MFKMTIKFIIVAILISISIFAYHLLKDLRTTEKLLEMPDYDFRAEAERAWNNGQPQTALVMLDYVIDNNLKDTAGAKQLREGYWRNLQKDKTVIGRMWAVGRGFSTGSANSKEEFGGAVAGDFIVWGDIRDLVNEIVFEDDTDEVIVSLSILGMATTFWAPADPAVSAIKAVKKADAVSGPFQKYLVKTANAVQEAKTAGKTITPILEKTFTPIIDLFNKSKTFSQFTTFMKFVDTPADAAKITKIIDKSPKNAEKLELLLTTAAKKGKKIADESLSFIDKYGQKGMDKIYMLARKGPPGLFFLVKHPRILKNTTKGVNLSLRTFKNWISENRFVGKVLLWGAITLPLFFSFLLLKPTKVIKMQIRKKHITYIILSIAIIILIYLFIFINSNNLEIMYDVRREITVSIEEEDTINNDDFKQTSYSSVMKVGANYFTPVIYSKLGFDWGQLVSDGDLIKFNVTITDRRNEPSSEAASEILYSSEEPRVVFIPCDKPVDPIHNIGKNKVIPHLLELVALGSKSGNFRDIGPASVWAKDNDYLIVEQRYFGAGNKSLTVGDTIFTKSRQLVGMVVHEETEYTKNLSKFKVYIYPESEPDFEHLSVISIKDANKIRRQVMKLRDKAQALE